MPSRPYSSFGSGDETGFPNRRAAAMAIPENDALSDALAQLNRLVVDQESLDERLNRVAALTCTTVSVCDMAAMTLMRDGRPSTDVCTDEATKEIDAAQYAAGTGPCLDAYVHREPRRIGSTRTDPRWPEFARAARDHGILSTLSLPLLAGERAFGALNLYSRQERAFSEEDEAMAAGLAEQASVVLANAELYWSARTLADQLQEALRSRAVIDQAKGIIMAGRGGDADAAFEALVTLSQQRHMKLREVAQEIVEAAVRRRSSRRPSR